MRLSEAIRLGSMMKPQCFEALHDDRGSCAIGAACDAGGLLAGEFFTMSETDAFRAMFPVAAKSRKCPDCGQRHAYAAIAHLNDTHRWTRERIADFVETIENQQPLPSVDALISQQVEA